MIFYSNMEKAYDRMLGDKSEIIALWKNLLSGKMLGQWELQKNFLKCSLPRIQGKFWGKEQGRCWIGWD